MPEILETRWNNLQQRLPSLTDFAEIVRRYAEPHRAYHTLAHIEHGLREFDAAPRAQDPLAVELAIWFHDVVYDTHAIDNEERSATLVRPLCPRAAEMVLASRHDRVPDDPDARLFVDIDLSILGQSPDRFNAYEAQIRREYAWVPGPIYLARRRKILSSFLKRSSLYATAHFRERYEAQARANLSRALGR